METIAEKKYDITEEACWALIKKFDGVCAGCGGSLSPIETVNNSDEPTFWSHCPECQCFDWGVRREVVDIAKHMVTQQNYVHYGRNIVPRDPSDAGEKYWLSSQIRGTVGIVSQVLQTQKQLQEQDKKVNV